MVHIFEFLSWYIEGDLNWNCSNHYLAVDDKGSVDILERGCQRDEDIMRKRFPDRIEHKAQISISSGKIDEYSETYEVKKNYPEIWEAIECYFSSLVDFN